MLANRSTGDGADAGTDDRTTPVTRQYTTDDATGDTSDDRSLDRRIDGSERMAISILGATRQREHPDNSSNCDFFHRFPLEDRDFF
jgi:hypothetical protein